MSRDISVFLSASGARGAREVIERRAGTAYDPRLAAHAVERFDGLLHGLDETRIWEQAMATEPAPQRWIAGDEIDAAFAVVATFTELKSRWLRGHAEAVAELAEAAAWRLGLTTADVTHVRRAALTLDLGRVGVSNAIWRSPGRSASATGSGAAASVLHRARFRARARAGADRRAGGGSPRAPRRLRLPPPDGRGGLERAARILAAADAYQAMREPRPHRAALGARAAEDELLRDARDGRLCSEAVDAVLAAAGHRLAPRPQPRPGGLTDRELEVLRALVAGLSNQQIGETLGISPKTAGHHVQHIYEKAGVRSRAGATVWAFEHSLVRAG